MGTLPIVPERGVGCEGLVLQLDDGVLLRLAAHVEGDLAVQAVLGVALDAEAAPGQREPADQLALPSRDKTDCHLLTIT
jgi:hypothetical protein